MPQSFVIIDGYNLLHAAGMGRRRYGPGDLERVRNKLLRFVVNRLTPGERSRTTIVFDATGATSGPGDFVLDGMRVCFNKVGSDADTMIEELVAAHSAPKQLSVVSGDRRLKTAILRRRGKAVDSDAYFEMLDGREPRQRADIVGAIERSAEPRSVEAPTTAELSDLELEMLKSFESAADLQASLKSEKVMPQVEGGDWAAHVQELIDELSENIEKQSDKRPPTP